MSEKKKNVFEMLIFAVILIAVMLYYGFGRHKDKSKDNNSDITAVQTLVPTMMPDVTEEPKNTPISSTSINDSSGTVSAKSDEYHNDMEKEVQ